MELNSLFPPSTTLSEGLLPSFPTLLRKVLTCSLFYFPFQDIHSLFHSLFNTHVAGIHYIPGPVLGSRHMATFKSPDLPLGS